MKVDWLKSCQNFLTLGGKTFDVAGASNQDIVSALRSLPSGLSERTRISTDWRYAPTLPASNYEFKAYDHHNAYNCSEDVHELYKAAAHYLTAAKSYEELNMPQAAANMYSLAAQSYIQLPNNPVIKGQLATEIAIQHLEKANALHTELGHLDFLYRDLDTYYNNVAETILAYRDHQARYELTFSAKDAHNRADKYSMLLKDIADQIVNIAQKIQGDIEPNALRIEEKEYGYSTSQPIGTDNVSPCVALMVQGFDKRNQSVVALAHISYETDIASIDNLFNGLPTGPKNVRLLGARFNLDTRSEENLCNVVRALVKHNVNIISADVFQGNEGPSSVVVNPKDFQIREAVPTQQSMFEVAYASAILNEGTKSPLNLAIDTRISDERFPSHINSQNICVFNRLIRNDWAEQYRVLKDEGFVDLGLTTHALYTLKKLRDEALLQLDDYAQTKNIDNLRETPLYLGENAYAHNCKQLDQIAHNYQNMSAHVVCRTLRMAIRQP